MKKALIIVDLQNDFLPSGALGIKEADRVIPVINRLQEHFELVVATKDFHPPNHISFAKKHGKKPGEIVTVKGALQELWPDHCVNGTKGAEFSAQLNTEKIKRVFHKGVDSEIDSYSAFFDNAHLRSTGLGEFLKKEGVEEIYLVGLATDYCIKYSAKDALHLGFKVHVIIDGCKGIDLKPGDIDKALKEMKEEGIDIIKSDEIHF